MALEAVIFDWGGTLTPWHTIDPFECWLAVTEDEAAARALHAAESTIWAAARDEHRSGTMQHIQDAARLSLTESQLRRYYDWWDEHSYLDPAAPALFRGLHERGLKVGVLSNTVWPAVEHERIFSRDAVDHLIDGAVYSSEIEWTKPHPAAFRAALAAVGVVDPSRAVFVGDRLFEDIYGANQVGMRAVLIPHSVIPQHQLGTDGTPDAVIDELGDLLAVIDGWLAGQR
ncbi:MAG TPA: HAD-IA family hydrolase [Jatrophihabitans sp.]|nr:HAD-IA family hydrolase [Jatrophihabitans sp.]